MKEELKRLENTLKMLEDGAVHHTRALIKIKDKGSIDTEVAVHFLDLYNKYQDIYDQVVDKFNKKFSKSLYVFNECKQVGETLEAFRSLVGFTIPIPEGYIHPDDRVEEYEPLSLLEQALDSDIPLLIKLTNTGYHFNEEESRLWLDLWFQYDTNYNKSVKEIYKNHGDNEAIIEHGDRVNGKRHKFRDLVYSLKIDLDKYEHPDDRKPSDEPPPRPRLVQ